MAYIHAAACSAILYAAHVRIHALQCMNKVAPRPPSLSAPSALLVGHCAGCLAQIATLSSQEHP